jgi:hypothetical protein
MSDINEAANKLAHDMMIHGIAYFKEGGDVEVLHEMRIRINSALAAIEAKVKKPIASTADIKAALKLDP